MKSVYVIVETQNGYLVIILFVEELRVVNAYCQNIEGNIKRNTLQNIECQELAYTTYIKQQRLDVGLLKQQTINTIEEDE